MKFTKSLILTTMLTILTFGMVVYTSCSKKSTDPCSSLKCINGGACNAGKCVCPTGHSGTYCEVVDPCLGIVCQNGGTCSSGLCTCPTGYEGTLCETESRIKFIKMWAANDQLVGGSSYHYNVAITAGTTADGPNAILIGNTFSDNYYVHGLRATVSIVAPSKTANTITIPHQYPDGGNYSVAGAGTITAGAITLTYTITNQATGAAQVYNCTWN